MRQFWSWWIRRRGLIGQLACILYVVQRPLGPYRTVYWRRKRRILAVLLIVLSCAAAVPVPQFVPRPLFVPRPAALPAPVLVPAAAGQSFVPSCDDAREVLPQSTGAGSAAGMTREEATAIDVRAMKQYGQKWCAGTCGMICACPRLVLQWKELQPGEKPDVGKVSTSAKPPPRRGYWETRTINCGPLGVARPNGRFTKEVQVWVDAPEKVKQQPDGTRTVSSRADELNRVPVESKDGRPAAASCPGGGFPGHR